MCGEVAIITHFPIVGGQYSKAGGGESKGSNISKSFRNMNGNGRRNGQNNGQSWAKEGKQNLQLLDYQPCCIVQLQKLCACIISIKIKIENKKG